MLPGADLWIFDGTQVLFNQFSENGSWSGHPWNCEPTRHREVVQGRLRSNWERAVSHDEYESHRQLAVLAGSYDSGKS
ncbi:DUF6879 family protein [Streptomyces sp. NBC_00576]|uniref:DUF6879 family protein n=1 Tax=Streptomyces sp. NBC_00576 TaxID=2903665 RepID=UPI002E7FF439|nr:DUF6879 family protein [Streptomyces sp. NBC_00576]